MEYDVIGIGNAIVDVLASAKDEFIAAEGLSKGSMTLIDAQRADNLYAKMDAGKEVSGGSVANSCAGIVSLGGTARYIGRVANDSLGSSFEQDINQAGVQFSARSVDKTGLPTARCLILVSPDAQRTMSTFLGACVELGPEDINETDIASAKVTYLEGYLWDPPKAKEAMLKAARAAQEAGKKVALSLSDAFCVDRHRESFQELIDAHVDILFANEDEALALTQKNKLDDALADLQGRCELIAITRGAQGSTVLCGDERIEVAAAKVDEVVDTTGAGDLYAAGFLFGYARGESPKTCAHYGGLAAAEIISHFGARPEVKLKTLLP
ncbi:MAG: adenosine kinase [Polyangiaceae bacterium]|nr:adenosine kinase [Polyangiaceae bacterium]